jgi:hypothetical protein
MPTEPEPGPDGLPTCRGVVPQRNCQCPPVPALAGQTPTTLRTGQLLPAGTYVVRVQGDTFASTRRLTVVR